MYTNNTSNTTQIEPTNCQLSQSSLVVAENANVTEHFRNNFVY